MVSIAVTSYIAFLALVLALLWKNSRPKPREVQIAEDNEQAEYLREYARRK